MTAEQQMIFNVIPRVASIISLGCSLSLIWNIFRGRSGNHTIYQRTLMGCAISTLVLSILSLWGVAAFPESSSVMGAMGTISTCSAQGFLYQWVIFIPPLYYMTLSLLSFWVLFFRLVHQNNNSRKKRQPIVSSWIENQKWMEKWMHLMIYLVPLIPASYLLSKEAYNPGLWICTLVSYPLGCNDDGDMPCIRGPSSWKTYQWYLRAVPFLVIVIVTPLAMLLFYIYILLKQKRKQEHSNARKEPITTARDAVKKSALYLVALLWSYALCFVRLSRNETTTFNNVQFAIMILAIVNENLLGLWLMLLYSCFYRHDKANSHRRLRAEGRDSTNVQSDGDLEQQERIYLDDTTTMTQTREEGDQSFGIFDGSSIAPDSPWASFLSEGVDDEYCNSNHRMSVLTSETTDELCATTAGEEDDDKNQSGRFA